MLAEFEAGGGDDVEDIVLSRKRTASRPEECKPDAKDFAELR